MVNWDVMVLESNVLADYQHLRIMGVWGDSNSKDRRTKWLLLSVMDALERIMQS